MVMVKIVRIRVRRRLVLIGLELGRGMEIAPVMGTYKTQKCESN